MQLRELAPIAILAISACIDRSFHRSDAGDDTQTTGSSTGGSSAGESLGTTVGETPGTNPTSTPSETGPIDSSGTSSPGTSESSGDGSTGALVTCGNGDREPGEVCFDPTPDLVEADPGTVDVALGDVDDDVLTDLAIASGGTIGVRSGDGIGGFGNVESYDITGSAVAVVTGDFDHDDRGDAMMLAQPLAVVTSWSGGWDLYTYSGNAQALDGYNDMVIGSFDYTYELDVVYTSASQVVYQSGSHPNFTYLLAAPEALPMDGTAPSGIATASFVFDGDGDPDIVVVHRNGNAADLVRGGGDAAWVHHGSFTVCPDGAVGARRVAIGDIDGDGYQDLVVTCEGDQLAVITGNDDGTFAAPQAYALPDAFSIVVADYDGAGEIDVAIAQPSLGRISVFVEEASTLVLATELEVGEPIAGIATRDIDGDGSRDLAAAVPSGAVAIFRSDP